MSFEEFESRARLFVLGALDDEELTEFEAARTTFGSRAEAVVEECQRLNAAFALTLRPTAPKPATRERLLSLIQSALGGKDGKQNGTN